MKGVTLLFTLLTSLSMFACASGGSGVRGNEGGSTPISNEESREYQTELLRCYKTGGSRIVKIEGELRCY